jgi:hypothetical protein
VAISGLTNGSSYSCTVTASNAVGRSAASAAVTATPAASAGTVTTAGVLCPLSYSAFNSSSKVNATSQSSWTCSGSLRQLTSNGIPDHPVTDGNFATPISTQSVSTSMRLQPTNTGSQTSGAGNVGYVVNGVKLDPGTAFKKCAKIVGDVMGSFHPHGDQAIYDALVRLAQDFASRYPMIDGQGNFGNIDGDSAAAYRYTEARMTDVARLLLEGIEDDAVDFRENYSGDQNEPIVLPSAVPNLLANGAQGIAVGMATSIPPHNVSELCDAALYLISHPTASSDQLISFVPGPDFPTGGIIIDPPEQLGRLRGARAAEARRDRAEGVGPLLDPGRGRVDFAHGFVAMGFEDGHERVVRVGQVSLALGVDGGALAVGHLVQLEHLTQGGCEGAWEERVEGQKWLCEGELWGRGVRENTCWRVAWK